MGCYALASTTSTSIACPLQPTDLWQIGPDPDLDVFNQYHNHDAEVLLQ